MFELLVMYVYKHLYMYVHMFLCTFWPLYRRCSTKYALMFMYVYARHILSAIPRFCSCSSCFLPMRQVSNHPSNDALVCHPIFTIHCFCSFVHQTVTQSVIANIVVVVMHKHRHRHRRRRVGDLKILSHSLS